MARIAVAQADRRADACHHSEVIVSRPDHKLPIMAAPGTTDQWRGWQKQMCKTSRRSSDECIAAAPDLWFEGLGFPHPVKPAKDPIRAPNLNGSRSRLGCRASVGSGAQSGRRDKDQISRMPRKSGTRFSGKDRAQKPEMSRAHAHAL
jgi:hypothetical protein